MMYIDKVILMIILFAISACCSDETLTRNARTISSFTQMFRHRANFSIPKFWFNPVQIRKWTRDGIVNLLHFVFFANDRKRAMQIEFGPEDGLRAAAAYQWRYGYRGKRLIEQLGNGFDPYIQPTPSIFLTPPLFSFPFSSSSSTL